jgi:hypothetical protein
MRFILGPIIIVLGILLMKYTVKFTDATGRIGYAEKWFQPPFAGTYTWWRLFGLLLIVLSVLYMMGIVKLDWAATGGIPEDSGLGITQE